VTAAARIRLYLVAGIGGAGLLVACAYQAFALGFSIWVGLAVLPNYLVGVFLVRRRPDHPQARRLLLVGSSNAVGVAIEAVVQDAYRQAAPGDWFWLLTSSPA